MPTRPANGKRVLHCCWRFDTKLEGEDEVEVKLPVGGEDGEVKLSVVVLELGGVEVADECAFI